MVLQNIDQLDGYSLYYLLQRVKSCGAADQTINTALREVDGLLKNARKEPHSASDQEWNMFKMGGMGEMKMTEMREMRENEGNEGNRG